MGNTSRKALVGSVICLLGATVQATASTAAPADELRGIVQSVMGNERHYEDLAVVITKEYVDVGEPVTFSKPNMQPVLESSEELDFVRQNGMYRHQTNALTRLPTGQKRRVSIWAFDLEKTRSFQGETVSSVGVAEVVDGPTLSGQDIRPHMFLLKHYGLISLSALLQGREEIRRQFPDTYDPGMSLHIESLGDGEFKGHRCKIVSLAYINPNDGEPYSRDKIWLAEDRNFIPIYRKCWTSRESATIANGEGEVTEWKEVKPGVWFPSAIDIQRYDGQTIMSEQKQTLKWREKYTVKSVDLNSTYDATYFHDVNIPAGSTVREVANRKVRRTYIQGLDK